MPKHGTVQAYHVLPIQQDGSGSVFTPKELRPCMADPYPPYPVLLPFGHSVSATFAIQFLRCFKRQFSCLNHTTQSDFPRVVATNERALSRLLHTGSLPTPHEPVGLCDGAHSLIAEKISALDSYMGDIVSHRDINYQVTILFLWFLDKKYSSTGIFYPKQHQNSE